MKSESSITLEYRGSEYLVRYSFRVDPAEPETREEPGCPASIQDAEILWVQKYIPQMNPELPGEWTLLNCPGINNLDLWAALDVLLQNYLDQSGLALLEKLADEMENRS